MLMFLIKMLKKMEQEAQKVLSESIKLSKMSKGYNWEIRILSLDVSRVEEINKQMVERFGDGSE